MKSGDWGEGRKLFDPVRSLVDITEVNAIFGGVFFIRGSWRCFSILAPET